MGRRRTLNVPQILETGGGSESNQPDQPYMLTTRAFRTSPRIHPKANIRPSSSSAVFLHKPVDRSFHLIPNDSLPAPSPSSFGWQTAPRADEAFRRDDGILHNRAVASGSRKRKNSFEVGPTCGHCYSVGSSSNLHLREAEESNRTSRNLRSRGDFNRDTDSERTTRLASNVPDPSSLNQLSDRARLAGFLRRSANTPTFVSGGRMLLAGQGVTIGSETGIYDDDNGTLRWNSIPQNSNYNAEQSFGGVIRRAIPSSGSSLSNFRTVQLTATNEEPPITSPNRSPRYRRVFAYLRLLQRNLRIEPPSDLFIRSSAPEGRLVLYGAADPFDQHRDMRLDVDNMSYEELLLLEERIGSVGNGLSDVLISKCLTESVLCSSDDSEEDGRCVICLEEYKNMDDLGNLKCGHDFHVGCIRKWLSMKNLCPICKSSAIDK